MPRVLITPTQFRDADAPYFSDLRADFDLVFPPQGVDLRDPNALVETLEDIDCVIATTEPYTALPHLF